MVPTGFNVAVTLHRRKKTLNKCIENLEEKGYKIDNRLKKTIPKIIIKKVFGKKYKKSDYYLDLADSLTPFVGLFFIPENIKCLTGNYVDNEEYIKLENACLKEKTAKILEKEDIIKEDKEMKKWIKDRNNALKELEKKYDEIPSSPKPESVVIISEEDSMDELYEKFERLQEMILRKQSSNDEINTDNNTLKYGNKEGKKDERVKQ